MACQPPGATITASHVAGTAPRVAGGELPGVGPGQAPELRTPTRRVVLKLGTRLLTGGGATLDSGRMAEVARAVASARPGTQTVLVSSGAIAAGYRVLGHREPPTRVRDRQAAAAVGQGRLMALWAQAFDEVGLEVGQLLLTNDCLTDRRRYVAARHTLGAMLEAGVVPILNENDPVTQAGKDLGDNDNLAAVAAALVDARLLALLTDVPGVMSGDPESDSQATVIPEADGVAELRRLCYKKKAVESRGGMESKLSAAERAGWYGIPTVIAPGQDGGVAAVLEGKPVGTLIHPAHTPLAARRHWMVTQRGLEGTLVVDDGAVRALQRRASLLPRGVVEIRGRFRRGDLVAVVDTAGVERARGIVRFDDRDVALIQGLHTREVREMMGAGRGHVVMRPDRMVLIGLETGE